MVRFVPPAPLDAATLGGAFFMLCVPNQYHAIAKRSLSSAGLCGSLRFSSTANRSHSSLRNSAAHLRNSIPLHYNDSLSISIASLCFSLPCRCLSSRGGSIQWLCKSKPFHRSSCHCHAAAPQRIADPLRCLPMLYSSYHCRCSRYSVQISSLPLRVSAHQSNTVASLSDSVANQGNSMP